MPRAFQFTLDPEDVLPSAISLSDAVAAVSAFVPFSMRNSLGLKTKIISIDLSQDFLTELEIAMESRKRRTLGAAVPA